MCVCLHIYVHVLSVKSYMYMYNIPLCSWTTMVSSNMNQLVLPKQYTSQVTVLDCMWLSLCLQPLISVSPIPTRENSYTMNIVPVYKPHSHFSVLGSPKGCSWITLCPSCPVIPWDGLFLDSTDIECPSSLPSINLQFVHSFEKP